MAKEILDKMWIWGHKVNAHRQGWGINMDSKATPADGAKYLGVPNILMVLPPSEEEARGVSHLKRIVWSVEFDESWNFQRDLSGVRDLAARHPKIEGVIVDDLTSMCIRRRGMRPETLAQLHATTQSGPKPLDLWGVFYTMDFDLNLADYIPHLDVLTLWTWRAEDLKDLEKNFVTFKKMAHRKPIVLGLYMYDYGTRHQMPTNLMEKQCRLALELLKQRRIHGMIFLASCITDLGFEAVEWTRQWINGIRQGRNKPI